MKDWDRVRKFKVLSDESRLQVLEVLLQGPRNVTQLMDDLRVSQSLLSKHLRVLRDAEFVCCQRQGQQVVYSLAPGLVGRGRNFDLGCCRIELRTKEF